MSMLDLTERQGEANGALVSFKVRADSKDEDSFVYEADVAFKVQTPEDARILGRVVPGAVSIYEKAENPDDNWKFRVTVTPDSSVKATLSHASGGKVAIQGAAEIKAIKVVASKKSVTATIRLLFGGQTADRAGYLAKLLRNEVTLSTEVAQQVFRFADRAGPRATVGHLAVAGAGAGEQPIVGRIDHVDGGGVTISTLDGTTFTVDQGRIVSSFGLTGDVDALLRVYATKCKRRKSLPTWDALLLAIAEEWDGATRCTADGATYELTAAVVERAVARLSSGEGTLPPEPGESAAAAAH